MDVGLVARLTLLLALGALLGWLVGVLVALSASSPAAAIVLRSVLTLVVLFVVTRVVVRRAYARPTLWVSIVAGAVLSYALAPMSWSGRALAGQAVLGPGLPSALLDLVPWVVVVLLASRSVQPRPPAAGYRMVQTWS